MSKNKLARIEFLVDMYGNGAGERVWIEDMDEKNIYYTDSFGRWCYLEKALDGVEFVYITNMPHIKLHTFSNGSGFVEIPSSKKDEDLVELKVRVKEFRKKFGELWDQYINGSGVFDGRNEKI